MLKEWWRKNKPSVEWQFFVLFLIGLSGLFVGWWRYETFCLPENNRRQQTEQQHNASENHAVSIIVTDSAFVWPHQQEQSERANQERGEEPPPLFCRTDFTDWLLALFTYYLVVVGYITLKSQERSARVMERAYIFGGPTDIDGRALGGDGIGYDLWVTASNAGRTPGIIKAIHVEFSATEPTKRIPKPATPLFRPDVVLAAGDELKRDDGSGLSISEDAGRPYCYGYIEYLDIFRITHTSWFCTRILRDVNSFTYAGGEELNGWD